MMSMSPDHGLSEFIQEPNQYSNPNPTSNPSAKRKRNLPGTPDPDAEVIALSPKSLMATNRFLCEICNKGFQRDQNLQLHRRGHNLPWKLKQRRNEEVKKKVYLCPEKSCVHHDPSRALGDLTGIKKHYFRKHGEKKWKCDKCSKKYAVQSDWKAHNKICGTREYKCDCGTLFCRKDSFITHRAFCDALTDQVSKFNSSVPPPPPSLNLIRNELISNSSLINTPQDNLDCFQLNGQFIDNICNVLSPPGVLKEEEFDNNNIVNMTNSLYYNNGTSKSHMSATALLQKAATMGSTTSDSSGFFASFMNSNNNMTRDFLGVRGNNNINESNYLLQEELAKFGSVGSGTDMSEYSITGRY